MSLTALFVRFLSFSYTRSMNSFRRYMMKLENSGLSFSTQYIAHRNCWIWEKVIRSSTESHPSSGFGSYGTPSADATPPEQQLDFARSTHFREYHPRDYCAHVAINLLIMASRPLNLGSFHKIRFSRQCSVVQRTWTDGIAAKGKGPSKYLSPSLFVIVTPLVELSDTVATRWGYLRATTTCL